MTSQQCLTKNLPTVQAALGIKETKGSCTSTDQTGPICVEPVLVALPGTRILLVHAMLKGRIRHRFGAKHLNHTCAAAIQRIINVCFQLIQ